MPATAVLVSADERAPLVEALTGLAEVRSCERAEELAELGAGADIVAVVAALRDAVGASTTPVLLALQQRKQTMPIVVPLSLRTVDVLGLVHAVETGLDAYWVIRGLESLQAAVVHAIGGGLRSGATAPLLRAVVPVVPASARAFLAFAAIEAGRPVCVRDAAHALGLSTRALEARLVRARLPTPQRVLGWARVLHAAWHLDVLDRTPKQVVVSLEFSSLSALYDLLHRYRSPPPAVLREQGGFRRLMQLFADELNS